MSSFHGMYSARGAKRSSHEETHRLSDAPFFGTVMGNRFFSAQVPNALAVAERIANALARIAAALDAQQAAERRDERAAGE